MTTTQELDPIYTPPGCFTLDKANDLQIRLGIQGEPFSGKTTAALTFPNPAVLSYDRKVSAHGHRSDVILIPFHDPAFIERYKKRDGVKAPPNRKEALIDWLTVEGIKLKSNQTLIIDGITGIEEEYHIWFRHNEHVLATSKSGAIDGRVEWNMKKSYFEEIHSCVKAIPANILFICHENPDRNSKGELTGKFRALLSGQSGDKLGANLTDLFRAIAVAKPKDQLQKDKLIKFYGLTETTYKEWIESTPPEHSTIYIWQTQEDETCTCGTSSLINCPKFVLASYNSFLKYRNKNKTNL